MTAATYATIDELIRLGTIAVAQVQDDLPHTLWDEFGAMPQNVTYRVLERSGHTPQLEEAKAFDSILLAWLQR